MKTIQQDLKSNNLSLNEATDVAQNCPLWRLMSTFGAMRTPRLAKKQEKMDITEQRGHVTFTGSQKLVEGGGNRISTGA